MRKKGKKEYKGEKKRKTQKKLKMKKPKRKIYIKKKEIPLEDSHKKKVWMHMILGTMTN